MKTLALAAAALVALPAAAEPDAPAARWYEKSQLFGYAKAGYFFVTPAADDALLGARDGFRMINLRVGLSLKPADQLEVVASVDGAQPRRDAADPLAGSRVVELKDAYLEWTPSRFAGLRIGQFKAPLDAEELLPDAQLPFITRSVVSDGAVPPDAYPVEGLSLSRQVGLQVASERLGSDTAGFRYAVAVVNGNGANVLNNDNNLVTPVARVSYEYQDLVTVSANAAYDARLEGVRPNRLPSSRLSYGGDVSVRAGGIDLLGVVLMRNTTHPGSGLPSESALGWLAQAHYLHKESGLEGGVRFASYEPSSVVPDDRVMEGAAMVAYTLKSAPLRLLLQYTLRLEEAAVAVSNDSVDVMGQVSW